MKITRDEVAKVATLSRLSLDDQKLDLIAGQFNDILDYMDLLNGLDTTDVEPLYSPVERATPLRPDEAVKRVERKDVLANAPESDGSFFVVPKIV